MLLFMILFTWALFVALSPGILLKIPAGGSPKTVVAVHGLLFALIYGFTHKMVWSYFYN
jgi:hypothetical protein